jgi:hypothetical protein
MFNETHLGIVLSVGQDAIKNSPCEYCGGHPSVATANGFLVQRNSWAVDVPYTQSHDPHKA